MLGFDYGTGDRLAKLIPEPIMGRARSPSTSTSPRSPSCGGSTTPSPRRARSSRRAKGLEGIVRNYSIHAAAVVIADRPLTDIVPLQLAEDRGAAENGRRASASYRTVTQYSMEPIEEIGLLKMDFLGLRNLDVIEDALDIIEQSARRAARHDRAAARRPPRPTRCSQRGDSVGVFQFESDGMQDALRKVRPTEFDDLVALVALYRPGRDALHRHLRAQQARPRRGAPTSTSACGRSRSRRYGVILYQEQSMQIAKSIAGFSGPEADDLRKAIGKKKREPHGRAQATTSSRAARATGTAEAVIAAAVGR